MSEGSGSGTLEGDLDHPLGPLLYAASTMHCMTVSLAQGGEGLGTMWGRERALTALREAGMRPEDPPEEWLVKAWDGDVLVDLIFWPKGLPIDDDVIERGDEMAVLSMHMRVMAIEDVLTTKLMALDEHHLRYEGLLQIAHALREQVDWAQVRAATASSPFARAFFVLLEGLEILPPQSDAPISGARPEPRVRVVTTSGSGSAAAG